MLTFDRTEKREGRRCLRAGVELAALSPHGVRRDTREYLLVRLDIAQRVPSPKELNDAITRSNALQEALWQQARAACAKDNGLGDLAQPQHRTCNRGAVQPVAGAQGHGRKRLLQERYVDYRCVKRER